MKYKRFSALLSIVLCIALLSAPLGLTAGSSAFSDVAANADYQYWYDGKTYYADSWDGHVYCGEGTADYVGYTDYPVDRIAVYGGQIYASCGSSLRVIDMSTKSDSLVFEAEDKITAFTRVPGCIYFLTAGKLYRYNLSDRSCALLLTGVVSFWLDNTRELSYMLDDDAVYTVNLTDGTTEKRPNNYSYLGDYIPVSSGMPSHGNSDQAFGIMNLRDKFPDGKYWNHANNPGSSNSVNNQDGYTSTPCPPHSTTNIGDSTCTCNGFAPNGTQLSWQCMGYAEKCGYDVTSRNPRNEGYGWTTSSSSSKLDDVKAGDIIRYKSGGHSLYVIGVSGNDVYYTDCNGNASTYPCRISWDRSISISTLKNSFTYIRIAPFEAPGGTSSERSVKLDANGGECDKSTIKVKGEVNVELPTPTRVGHNFLGWYTEKTGGTQISKGSALDRSVSTLYAHWELQTYTLSYDVNGGNSMSIPVQTRKYGTPAISVTYSKPSRNNYVFVDWNTARDGTGTSYKAGDKFSDDKDTTLYAQWKGKEFTVTFNSNGGNSCSPSSKKVEYGSPYGELPISTRDGYNFLGWSTNQSSLNVEIITATSIVEITTNQSLYARWERAVYTISYDCQGGSGTYQPSNKYYNETYTVSRTEPTREGFDFICWNDKPDGTGNDYNPGTTFSVKGSVTLYARWDRHHWNVTYDANGGSGAPDNQTKYYAIDLTLSSTRPTRSGYELDCWSTNSYGGGTKYSPGDTYKDNGPLELYAVWVPGTYTMTFNANGGKCSSSSKKVTYLSKYGSLPTPEREGYDFTGWYKNSTLIESNNTVHETSSFTVTAGWKLKTYTVSYTAPDGTDVPENQTKSWGIDLYITSAVPQRDGYVFESWNTSADGTGKLYRAGHLYTENAPLNLYAQWVKEEDNKYINGLYRADFCTRDGLAGTADYTSDGFSTAFPAVPEKPGYSGAWLIPEELPEGGTVIFAEYTPVTYTIKYMADGSFVDERTYTVENKKVNPPTVPSKRGYDGSWEDCTLTMGNVTVNAVYTRARYTVTFVADDVKVAERTYTYGETSVENPPFPEKDGFDGEWEKYTVDVGNITVKAIYYAKRYTATFVANGKTVGEVVYSMDDKSIPAEKMPAIPEIAGFSGYWPQYTLKAGGITLNAYYRLTAELEILGYESFKRVGYMTTITFVPNISIVPAGSEIHWIYNGNDAGTGDDDNRFTVERAKKPYSVKCVIVENGRESAESNEEYVFVDEGIFSRIVALFRKLFGILPVIIQGFE